MDLEKPLVKACGLGRRKPGGDDWLLRGICCELRPGDRLAVIGPSGAGKTLLLRALALLDPLDEGVIQWRGQDISGQVVPSYRREVTYLHQRPALFEGSVEANLRHPFSLKINRDRSFDRERLLHLLDSLGRGPSFLAQASRDLSEGESQIVALLRTLQLEPTVLLLDEPTASLDEGTALAIEELVDHWLSEAPSERALLWVSHDQDQAHRIAHRRLRMMSGRLEPER
jgi:putative ABC transport system ATP-binding protein